MSGWTPALLKKHFDALRSDDKEALQIALTAADKANDKAETAQARVNASQNEFRGALKDQAATLMPRSEYDVNHKALQKQIDSLQRLVYIGLGIVLTLQVVLQFVKH